MALSFEQPQNTSENEKKNDIRVESTEKRPASESIEKAQQEVVDFLDDLGPEVKERLAADPIVHLHGRDYELAELSETYEDIAFMQKKLRVIEERLGTAIINHDETVPSTPGEAVSYFTLQLLARAKQAQETKITAFADLHSLAVQHEDISRALAKDEPEDWSSVSKAA